MVAQDSHFPGLPIIMKHITIKLNIDKINIQHLGKLNKATHQHLVKNLNNSIHQVVKNPSF